jgi:hypothetical protein
VQSAASVHVMVVSVFVQAVHAPHGNNNNAITIQ